MHAARRKAIRELLLDDVDLGNRRLTIGGRVRPIDELTRQILLEWLSYRSARWPGTAYPHLLINQMSANGTGPVSTIYFAKTRYAENARQLLITAAEEHAAGDVAERVIPLGLLLSRSRRDIPRLRRAGIGELDGWRPGMANSLVASVFGRGRSCGGLA